MKLTNRMGLPSAIVRAIANDDYDRGDAWRSITQLVGPPRLAVLRAEHEDEIEEDAADRIFLLLGKCAHSILERAEDADGVNVIVEKRLFIEVAGARISGAFDRLAIYETDGSAA